VLRLHSDGILGNPRKRVTANCQSEKAIIEERDETKSKDSQGNSEKEETGKAAETNAFLYDQMKEEKTSAKTKEPINEDNTKCQNRSSEENAYEREAWELLKSATVYYCGNPVGTIAANDPSDHSPLNYDQVFIRDFIPSAIAFLLKGEYDIVRHFILYTLQLQVCCLIEYVIIT
jgi:hypothetical protein